MQKSDHKFEQSRAFSVIEFAITLPILLTVILASFEINNVLQARSAAQAALQEGLRCLYPVDGACNNVTVAPESAKRFEWYKACGTVDCIYPKRDFAGEARYLKLPMYGFEFGASPLVNGAFDAPLYSYLLQRMESQYAVTTSADFWLEKGYLPRIVGSDGRNPSFQYLNSGDSYPVYSGPGITLTQDDQLEIADGTNGTDQIEPFTIKIQDLPQHTPTTTCFYTSEEDPNFRVNDDSDMHDGCKSSPRQDKVRVAFHLKGNSSGSASNACGKVTIMLQKKIGNNWHDIDDLGGQVFTGAQSPLNFFPRGIPCEVEDGRCKNDQYIDNSLTGYPEFRIHRLIEFDYAQDYRLKLTLMRQNLGPDCEDGTLKWKFTDVNFYLPDVRHNEFSAINCTNMVPTRDLPPGYVCNHSQQIENENVRGNSWTILHSHADALAEGVVGSQPVQTIPADSLNVTVYSDADLNAQREAWRVQLQQQYGIDQIDLSETLTEQSTRTFSASCPAIGTTLNYQNLGGTETTTLPNYGVPESAGSDGFIRASTQAWGICPPELSPERAAYIDALSRGAVLSDARWTESATPQDLPGGDAYRWTKATCSSPVPVYADLPPPMSFVPESKLDWNPNAPIRATGEFTVLNTGEGLCRDDLGDPADPDWMKLNDPNYSCPEFEIGRVTYQGGQTGIPGNSLFADITPNLDDPSCNTCEMLRTEARNLDDVAKRLPPDRFFSWTDPIVDEPPLPCPPGISLPYQDCVVFRTRGQQSDADWKLIAGGPYPGGYVPAECSSSDQCSCRAEFLGYEGGVAGEQKFDTAEAERRMNEMLAVAVPWAKPDCEGVGCSSVSVLPPAGYDSESGYSGNPENAMFEATAKIDVPLHILPGVSVPLTLHAKERWEGAFVR